MYSALLAEGRALSSEESAAVDAELGLEVGGPAYGSSSDSDDGVGPEEEDEAVASRELERNPLLALQASPSGRFLSDAHYERLLSNAASLQARLPWRGAGPGRAAWGGVGTRSVRGARPAACRGLTVHVYALTPADPTPPATPPAAALLSVGRHRAQRHQAHHLLRRAHEQVGVAV